MKNLTKSRYIRIQDGDLFVSYWGVYTWDTFQVDSTANVHFRLWVLRIHDHHPTLNPVITIEHVSSAKAVLTIKTFAVPPAGFMVLTISSAIGGQFGCTRTSLNLAPTHRATPFVQPNPA